MESAVVEEAQGAEAEQRMEGWTLPGFAGDDLWVGP